AAPLPVEGFDAFTRSDDVLIALGSRNQRLSQFWLSDQSGVPTDSLLEGKKVVILDNEDDFIKMLSHVFGVLGMSVDVIRHEDWTTESLDHADLAILGPGPGDPRSDEPKMRVVRAAADRLLERGQRFLAVCLGHQVLCDRLGFDLVYKDIVFQGTQSTLEVLDRKETVGFYNTFVARIPEAGLPAGVSVQTDPETGDIHLITGPNFRGMQFHPESILTQNGFAIVRDLLRDLFAAAN
ncbi:MAG: aminodeoxychorismate/anthranilate synthase component II, partial [Aeromicrobium sp.]